MVHLQRTLGNRAVVRLLGAVPRVQRLVIPYSYTDHGRADPNGATRWLEETIVSFVYQRGGISNAVKGAVNGFGDGANAGTYKHHVPYDRIWRRLEDRMTRGLTRDQIVQWLRLKMEQLDIDDTSDLDPRTSKIAFNSWVSWVVDAICDWPENIFRWPTSTGDGNGTKVDTPTGAPAALTNRLTSAAGDLADVLGVDVS